MAPSQRGSQSDFAFFILHFSPAQNNRNRFLRVLKEKKVPQNGVEYFRKYSQQGLALQYASWLHVDVPAFHIQDVHHCRCRISCLRRRSCKFLKFLIYKEIFSKHLDFEIKEENQFKIHFSKIPFQGAFRCDTNQPGCQNVCYNRFSPISHMRFWAFQMMFVCLPSLAFMTFAQFEIAKIELVKKERADEEKKTRAVN